MGGTMQRRHGLSARLAGPVVAAGLLATFAAVAPAVPAGADAVSGEVRVVSNWTGSEGEAFQAVIDAFQAANPDVTVTIEQVPFDQTQALLTQRFASGDPPD